MTIQYSRDDLASVLPSGLPPVHQSIPRGFQAPGVIIMPTRTGDFLITGQLPGLFRIALDILIVTRPAGDELSDDTALQDVAAEILPVLPDTAWVLQGIAAPAIISIEGTDFPCLAIRVASQIKLY